METKAAEPLSREAGISWLVSRIRPRAGRTDSTEYLRFRVRNRSLLRRPDGTSFGPNDSLLITLRVTDPAAARYWRSGRPTHRTPTGSPRALANHSRTPPSGPFSMRTSRPLSRRR